MIGVLLNPQFVRRRSILPPGFTPHRMAACSGNHPDSPSLQDYDHLMAEIQTVLTLEEASNSSRPLSGELSNKTDQNTPRTLETNKSLLHAIDAGDVAMVAMLLQHESCDSNFRDANGNSLVRLAIKMGQLESVKMLVERGADVLGDVKHLDHGQKEDDLRRHLEGREDCKYVTLIMEATLIDNDAILDVLIGAGCSVNATDYITNKTALHLAASRGSVKCAEKLIFSGAHLDARDSRQNTPLMMGVFENNPVVCELLLSAGSDVNVKCSLSRTPLIWAISLNPAVVDLLLYYGADTNKADGFDSTTPLHFAILQRNEDCIEKIINCSANVNAIDSDGKSPLSIAIHEKVTGIIELLLQSGANPSVKDNSGMTPLLETFYEERYDIARLLLSHNASVDVTLPGTNLTLYQVCLQTGRQEAVKLIHQVGLPRPFEQVRHMCDTTELKPRHLYSLSNDLEFVDWLRAEYFNPKSLSRMCQMVIRRSLGHGPSFKQKVQTLPTAPKLRDIISFEAGGFLS